MDALLGRRVLASAVGKVRSGMQQVLRCSDVAGRERWVPRTGLSAGDRKYGDTTHE